MTFLFWHYQPSLLKQAGFKKRDGVGVSISSIVYMIICSCFFLSNKTVYGNYTSSRGYKAISKSGLYRFLSNPRNNWRKLLLLFSRKVISKFSALSDSDRKFCLIIDDSVLKRVC